MPLSTETDQQLRVAAFAFLDGLAPTKTALVTQHDLTVFSFKGSPVRLMATQQGIWKPAQLDAALSFRTVFASDPSKRPYDDEEGPDGFTPNTPIIGPCVVPWSASSH